MEGLLPVVRRSERGCSRERTRERRRLLASRRADQSHYGRAPRCPLAPLTGRSRRRRGGIDRCLENLGGPFPGVGRPGRAALACARGLRLQGLARQEPLNSPVRAVRSPRRTPNPAFSTGRGRRDAERAPHRSPEPAAKLGFGRLGAAGSGSVVLRRGVPRASLKGVQARPSSFRRRRIPRLDTWSCSTMASRSPAQASWQARTSAAGTSFAFLSTLERSMSE